MGAAAAFVSLGGRMESSRGTFSHRIILIGPAGATETLEALVDTDTLFAVFPAPILGRLGVNADRTARLRIGGGERVRRLGDIQAELKGQQLTIVCVFGEANEPSRIGRHTLDTFLLEADVVKRRLVPKTLRVVTPV